LDTLRKNEKISGKHFTIREKIVKVTGIAQREEGGAGGTRNQRKCSYLTD